MKKVFLPINVRIDNKKILFVGGGKIAMHKIQTVEQYTGNITILAPEIHQYLQGKGFTEIVKRYEPADLEGAFLVYASTNDEEVNRQIKEDAERLGILVNVVDNRELSSFISPAVIRKDEMTITVSSNGENVKKSVAWRNKIREMMREDDTLLQ
ncbi:MAG: bifunctional precorrin-2 dehydrogenase/sirohydrochlorin ferrochelatase [Chlorobium sp.]|uniref:precorrin-2 dehydrogenase/sirohydrochlorin ferrochelatase family protein n=1 Tax=Chlorobium sp. TaxID=1095 RepID=UPI002F40EDFA